MDIDKKEIYSEVYGILEMLGNSYKNRLPVRLYNMIKNGKSDTYNPSYDGTIALEKQNVKKEAMSMIALFHLNYWCETEEEKEKLISLFKENEDKYQAEIREKYNPDNIFKNKQQEAVQVEVSAPTESVAMVEYKENIFKRIWNKFISLFRKK